ncbi:MAG: 1-deoxy-D-xylulose-5-phosphate reductoisomerase [Magnetococcales bacterium]|nr:1-deoxy-D-xylulose-5-phosphate reductoisomerase [Magnetococcales bacterium]NGZ06760.1 1-deoxy-D-xylulose-5-phosphate reductoisomerase [Magnetococcales bacterium]
MPICGCAGVGFPWEPGSLGVKRIAILGSTGSIGVSALDVIAAHPDRFRVVALAAGSNVGRLIEQARRFRPEVVALRDLSGVEQLRAALSGQPTAILAGDAGVERIGHWESADLVLSAMVGAAGLRPTWAALQSGKEVALANKECLVISGALFMNEAHRCGARIIPVDSEHSAIFQLLYNGRLTGVGAGPVFGPGHADVRLILTASGGPFRGWERDRLVQVTPEQALAHPNWSMGRKITIDSATCMNKGLEVIEAHHLFGIPAERIQVVIHPESIVHSMVAYPDGSVLAQMGVPDMRTPITVALAWPERIAAPVAPLDLPSMGKLHFLGPPDPEAFPCLSLAYAALQQGGAAPAILNGANEVAVAAFLGHEIGFADIPRLIQWTLEQNGPGTFGSVEELLAVDRWARDQAQLWIIRHGVGSGRR